MSYELSENSLDYTIELLLQHCKNKQKFKKDSNQIATGGEDHNDYTDKGIKRSKVSSKKFIHSIFRNSAAAGSNFFSCTFDNCKFINANFQECSFIKSRIINDSNNDPIIHSNFNESLFSDGFVVENTCFEHSVFYNTAFIGGTIKNTTFYACTLEGAIFSNIEMQNVKFTDLNIDYAVFENVEMQNVILPFSQICYTFGLLSYLKETTDNVYITSVANENGYISKDEFLKLIPHFIKYYTETRDFFPLANIYFFIGDKENAKKSILAGISESVIEVDFRKIKYLCKLISVYEVFNYHERQEINDYINSKISFCDMHPSLLYSYTVYKKEIESYLLNNNRKGIVTAEINIATNIFPNEAKKLGILISTIEEIIDLYKSPLGEHQIVCRHNSAESILITIQELLPTAVAIVAMFYSVLVSCTSLADKILDIKTKKSNLQASEHKNKLELEKTQVEIEKLRNENIHYQLENELKQIELDSKRLEQLEKTNKINQMILSKNITQNNIEVTNMNHIIYGNIPTQIDKSLVQYSYQKSNC